MSKSTLTAGRNDGAKPHIPVMPEEVLHYLSPKDGEVYVDGTFGAGGYTRAILSAAKCKVYAIDCDPYLEVYVSNLAREFEDRFAFLPGKFSDMTALLKGQGVEHVNGIVLDIGVSSMQIDTPRRGFSFQQEGPLDMRMNCEGETAADLVNSAKEEELAGIIFKYGGERMSRRIARAIVTARAQDPITRTEQLAGIIRGAVRVYNDTIDPATRTFQALRIFINDELNELIEALAAAEQLLSPEGRLVVVSFHSEEDAIVKKFLNERSGKKPSYSRYQPIVPNQDPPPSFSLLSSKAIKPGEREVDSNRRSRSAKLRAARRTDASAWGKRGGQND